MNIEISKVANLPTNKGMFKTQIFKEREKEHMVIFKKPFGEHPFVRIHSECITGDTMGSLKCDCGEQLQASLNFIQENAGLLLYLRQEGRNIGLLNKINAYALQDRGLDTIQANHQLGFKADLRTYEIVEFILNYYKISSIQLLTNNPEKLNSLKNIKIHKRVPLIIKANEYNEEYLRVKKEQMGHMI